MTPETEARHAVADYMVGMPTGYLGTFKAVFQVMFGPLQFDAHVRAFRALQFYTEQQSRLADADAAVRAECARMSAEFQAKLERNSRPVLTLIAAE